MEVTRGDIVKDYQDIINLPHRVSQNHKPMSLYDRAAQFQPFAALTGYNDLIFESSRLTKKKIILSEDEKNTINDKLLLLDSNIKIKPLATFTYFIKDNKKSGGNYITISGNVKKIDLYNKIIILTNNQKISIDDIIDIKC